MLSAVEGEERTISRYKSSPSFSHLGGFLPVPPPRRATFVPDLRRWYQFCAWLLLERCGGDGRCPGGVDEGEEVVRLVDGRRSIASPSEKAEIKARTKNNVARNIGLFIRILG